jgi:HEAT repeat protein
MTDHWPGESWRAAIVALRSFEADGLPTLVTIATNHARPLEVRRLSMQAVASLHTVETYESWVVPAILPCLKEEGMEQATVVALGSLRIPPEFALPVLTNAVVSKRAEVRVWAVVALGRYGSQATPAVPVLLHAVHDPDPRVQQEATDTLKAIAPEVLTNGVKNF